MLITQAAVVSSLLLLGNAHPSLVAREGKPSCFKGNPSQVVKSGDTCTSITAAANVSTLTFQNLNCLNQQCTDLQLGSTACLPGSCKTHVVQAGETCDIIAKANGISTADFFSFNPGVLKPACTNINTGTTVCVDEPKGKQLVLPACGNGTKPAMGRIAPGTNPKCPKADLYTVMPGDTCIKIVEEHGICLDEFYAQNKGVQNPSCSNLVPGDSYCVAKIKGTS